MEASEYTIFKNVAMQSMELFHMRFRDAGSFPASVGVKEQFPLLPYTVKLNCIFGPFQL